jgi:hypothetical protein
VSLPANDYLATQCVPFYTGQEEEEAPGGGGMDPAAMQKMVSLFVHEITCHFVLHPDRAILSAILRVILWFLDYIVARANKALNAADTWNVIAATYVAYALMGYYDASFATYANVWYQWLHT